MVGMKRIDKSLLLAAVGVLAVIGCSAGDTQTNRNPGGFLPGVGGTSGGRGGTGVGAGGSTFGNAAGTGAGNAGTIAVKPPPLGPIDPSAAPFVRDDTAMSGLDPNLLNNLKMGAGACNVQMLYPYE